MPRRYFHRSDSNSDEMVEALRKLGLSVHVLNDVVDILVGYGGLTVLGEVRPEGQARKPREGRQKKFHDAWTGGVYWIQSQDDCIQLAQTLKRWKMAIMASEVPF